MNDSRKFTFNNKCYDIGTIIKIKEQYKKYFRFNSVLKYVGYNTDEKKYCFFTIQDCWEIYKLSSEELLLYIECILKECVNEFQNKYIKEQYIDGIVSAWMWYILIMFFALFFKGIENVIAIWCIASYIFFSWRNGKIKGG